MDKILKKAIERAGGLRALSRAIGISHQSISGWKKCPLERVIAVEAATGISREDLRSDVFKVPHPKNLRKV